MKQANKLALIVAFYLSKFDDRAYQALGFGNQGRTHEAIGRQLGVKPNTIKNMRDEFDPLHTNKRVGWYQKELGPSRQLIANAFDEFTELDLETYVKAILRPSGEGVEDYGIDELYRKETKRSDRALTGRSAEEFFIAQYNELQAPSPGELVDMRHSGKGYDFEIRAADATYYVEVKGLSDITGGLLLTAREWEMANRQLEQYFLAVVTSVHTQPTIFFIKNPAKNLSATPFLVRSIQMQWSISAAQVASFSKGS